MEIRFPGENLNNSPLVDLARRRAAALPYSDQVAVMQSETAIRRAIRDDFRSLLLHHNPSLNFKKLEEHYTAFRLNTARTPSGVSKSVVAFSGFMGRNTDWAHLTDATWATFKADVSEWIARYPQSPAPHIYWATLLSSQAIEATNIGRGPPILPNEDAIKARLLEVAAYLEKNKAVASQDPLWYTRKIAIMTALNEPIEEILEVVDEGSAREPSFAETYFAAVRAVGSLTRNYPAYIDSIANLAVKRSFATDGNQLYARIYWVALTEIAGLNPDNGLKIDWKKMGASMREVAKAYPVQWNIQHFAMFACLSGQTALTSEFMLLMRGRPDLTIWPSIEMHDYCKGQTTSGPVSPGKRPSLQKASAP